MSKLIATIGLAALCASLYATRAGAHCQVPCGIYDDAARVAQLREDIKTIDKAATRIRQLTAKRDAQSTNQVVRWVVVKEQHAEKIIRTVSDYFLTQKVKPATKGSKAYPAYLAMLARHHAVMVAAMKCKQTAKSASVKALSAAVSGIAGYWSK